MFDAIIGFSLKNRALVLFSALGLLAGGFYTALRLPIDVFPDLNAPTVTLLTEAHGMAPEQVEALVTFPLESAVNGATGVRRVRSFSAPGISIVHVEFDWEMDVYAAQVQTLQPGAAQGGQDPSPVGVAGVQGGLDQRRMGDGECRLSAFLDIPSSPHIQGNELGRAFAVTNHGLGQFNA